MTATRRKWPLPGDPDASIGARHHRLPRFYLDRFANEREQVATIDRRTGARRTTTIKETAAEKDFYTAINTEGQKDGKTEHLLSHIEGNAARAIRNILSPGLGLFPPHGAILQIHGQMPIDLSRYNQPVTNAGTQRRR